MTENAVAREIVDVALRVHRGLGPGLFESVYEAVLASELEKRGLQVATQRIMPVVFEGTRFEKQLLTYLRLADKRLGLLINFNGSVIRNGIKRLSMGWKNDLSPRRKER